MAEFEPLHPVDPDFERRVRESFARQRIMETLGARLAAVRPGEVEIELPYREDLTQQHRFVHAGVIATILDSACGYAAFTLMPADAAVLTVEYKINLMRPAAGERFIARARVVKPGRTVTVSSGDAVAIADGGEKTVATMLGTVISLQDRPDLRH